MSQTATEAAPIVDRPSTRRTWLEWVRIGIRIVIPVALFGRVFTYTYLNVFAAPRMLVGDDWTTYLVAPNYLRGSPALSLPIGKLPDYIAPFGSDLARTDTVPFLTPIYRLLIALFPDRPIQLVGWMLLIGFVLTFNCFAGFLDAVRSDARPLPREALTLMLATIAVLAPFWQLQYVHPALMQAWIVVAALAGALRRCPTALGGMLEPPRSRWVGVLPVCAAAAVQPYFLPMALLPAFAPDFVNLRSDPRWVLKKTATTIGLVVVILVVSGFVGGNGNLGADGFGAYSADLTALIDPDGSSRFVRNITTRPSAIGGYAYVGLGALVVLFVAALMALRTRPWPRRSAEHAALVAVYVAVAVLTLYAVLPQIRVVDHLVLDFTSITRHFDSLTGLLRTNGRFVWPLVWLLLMMASARLLAARRQTVVLGIAAGALLIQFADVIPFADLIRNEREVEYSDARSVLEQQRSGGIRSLQFQPPIVVPGCYDPATLPFSAAGDVLLAASVLELPVNSGYQTRPDADLAQEVCVEQAGEFGRGDYDDDVGYVVPAGNPTPSGLQCDPLTSRFVVCRSQP